MKYKMLGKTILKRNTNTYNQDTSHDYDLFYLTDEKEK